MFLFLGGVPCLECVFLLRSLVLLLLRLGWLALPLSAAVLLGTHSLGGCWLSSSLLVLLLVLSLLLVLALCLVAFSRSSEAAPSGKAKGKGQRAKGKSVIPFAFFMHAFCLGACASGGACLFRCCLVAFGLLLIGVPVLGLRCSWLLAGAEAPAFS